MLWSVKYCIRIFLTERNNLLKFFFCGPLHKKKIMTWGNDSWGKWNLVQHSHGNLKYSISLNCINFFNLLQNSKLTTTTTKLSFLLALSVVYTLNNKVYCCTRCLRHPLYKTVGLGKSVFRLLQTPMGHVYIV